jgi:hypothetical protein
VKANYPVTETVRTQVDIILDFHLQDTFDVTIEDAIDPVWRAILDQMRSQKEYSDAIDEIDAIIRTSKEPDAQWEFMEAKEGGSLTDALTLALAGQFDKACAIALQLDDPLAQLFAVKTGLLALSMTRTAAPQLYELRRIAETLPLKYQPYTELVYASTLYHDRLISYANYVKVYQNTASKFEFCEHEECVIFALLFIDTRVVTVPDFAQKLAKYFEKKSPILQSYILAMLDRERLFTKLYSITSYSEFKDQVSTWKTKIASILDDINHFLKPGVLGKLLKSKQEAGLTGSLNLGTYIALYTALAESPVLNLKERIEVLNEVLSVYTEYFRKLLKSDLPLFAYTVDSVFQSLSVIFGELFYLLAGDKQNAHLAAIKSYLQDVLDVVSVDWLRKHPDTSTLFVMSNAIFPVLMQSDAIGVLEVRFVYLAMRLLNTMALMKLQDFDVQAFATDLLNIKTTLASLTIPFLPDTERNQFLEDCVNVLLQGHKFFITHGVLCRDDIASATLLTGYLTPTTQATDYGVYIDLAVTLNRIAVPDMQRHESDIAMLATPYLGLLRTAIQYLKDEKYVKLARIAYDQSIEVWTKFGFEFKAQEFTDEFESLF